LTLGKSARWHSTKNSKRVFAECRPGDTRQRLLCQVPAIWRSAKHILKLKKKSLPSARSRALGKVRVNTAGNLLSLSLSHSPRRRCRKHAAAPPPCPRRRSPRPCPLPARAAPSPPPPPKPSPPQPRPRRAYAVRRAPAVPASYDVPPSCSRCAPVVSPPCVPSLCPRRLARDPSVRPRPVVLPTGYD
jgi:hypothetical protein